MKKKYSERLKEIDKDNIYQIPSGLINLYDSWERHPKDERILIGKLPKVIMDEIDIMLDKAREEKEHPLSFLKVEHNYGIMGNDYQVGLNSSLFNDSFLHDYLLHMAGFYISNVGIYEITENKNITPNKEKERADKLSITWAKKHKKFEKWLNSFYYNISPTIGNTSVELRETNDEVMRKLIRTGLTFIPKDNIWVSRYTNKDKPHAWFNFAYKGDYNPPHVHPMSTLSAVIYVKDEEKTPTIFIENNIEFQGKPGDILMFPADMKHGVDEKKTNKERITIATNLFADYSIIESTLSVVSDNARSSHSDSSSDYNPHLTNELTLNIPQRGNWTPNDNSVSYRKRVGGKIINFNLETNQTLDMERREKEVKRRWLLNKHDNDSEKV